MTSAVPKSPAPQSNRDAIGARIRVKAGARILIISPQRLQLHFNNTCAYTYRTGIRHKNDWVEVPGLADYSKNSTNLAVEQDLHSQEGAGDFVAQSSEELSGSGRGLV